MTLEDEAIQYAKRNRTRIAREITDPDKFPPSKTPVSVFMAGSPGAGKTEYSKSVLSLISAVYETVPIRVDGDELRKSIPGYSGSNSSDVQRAVTSIVERIYDFILDNNQTAIIDGTLANYDKAKSNIERSLRHNRKVFVFYIYQHPATAWKFTIAREVVEGRNIPKDAFIRQFIGARETIGRLQQEFQERIRIVVVRKNFQTHEVESLRELLTLNTTIDDAVPERYTAEEVMKLL